MTDEQVRPFVNDIVERLLNTDRGYDLIGRDCADAADEIVGLRSACSAYRARLATAENELVAQEARARKLEAALERIAESRDAGRHDGLPEECPAHDQYTMWLDARAALAEGRGK